MLKGSKGPKKKQKNKKMKRKMKKIVVNVVFISKAHYTSLKLHEANIDTINIERDARKIDAK